MAPLVDELVDVVTPLLDEPCAEEGTAGTSPTRSASDGVIHAICDDLIRTRRSGSFGDEQQSP